MSDFRFNFGFRFIEGLVSSISNLRNLRGIKVGEDFRASDRFE